MNTYRLDLYCDCLKYKYKSYNPTASFFFTWRALEKGSDKPVR